MEKLVKVQNGMYQATINNTNVVIVQCWLQGDMRSGWLLLRTGESDYRFKTKKEAYKWALKECKEFTQDFRTEETYFGGYL
jgi:hypothetical protein